MRISMKASQSSIMPAYFGPTSANLPTGIFLPVSFVNSSSWCGMTNGLVSMTLPLSSLIGHQVRPGSSKQCRPAMG